MNRLIALGILFLCYGLTVGFFMTFFNLILWFSVSVFFLLIVTEVVIAEDIPNWFLGLMGIGFLLSLFSFGFSGLYLLFYFTHSQALILVGEGFFLIVIGLIVTFTKLNVSRKAVVTVAGCLFFVFLYFSSITLILPSTVLSKPSWIRKGIYVEYWLERYSSGTGFSGNGTYRWEVISLQSDSATVNATLHWQGSLNGPENLTGIVNLNDGMFYGKRLWLTNYFNRYLLSYSTAYIQDHQLRVVGVEKLTYITFDRTCYKVRPLENIYRHWDASYYYDVETGVLLWYRYAFPLGRETWTITSTNLDLISKEQELSRSIIDLAMIIPLFALPLAVVFWFLLKPKSQLRPSPH